MRIVFLLVLWTVAAGVGSTETSWGSWSWTRSPRSVREFPLGAISLHEPFGWLEPANR